MDGIETKFARVYLTCIPQALINSFETFPDFPVYGPEHDIDNLRIETLRGPDREPSVKQELEGVASGQSLSTYSVGPKGTKLGEPICDQFSLKLLGQDKALCCVTDGCGWGRNAKDAAVTANDAFIAYSLENLEFCSSTKQVAFLLLNAVFAAQQELVQSKPIDDVGTTTLLGGMLFKTILHGGDTKPTWCYICASIGDCKSFLFQQETKQIKDITYSNREHSINATDPGGRLGPQSKKGGQYDLRPDARNLNVYLTFCQPNDVLMLMSDGVHDNFDPEEIGFTPNQACEFIESKLLENRGDVEWESLKHEELHLIKRRFSEIHIAKTILSFGQETGAFSDADCINPAQINAALMKYCDNITLNSRTFLENHNEKLPKNYQLYPGKMDHTTCVAFFVDSAQHLASTSSHDQTKQYIPKPSYPPHCLPLQPSIDDILTYEIPAAKILISGASGMVGTAILELLSSKGHSIMRLDRRKEVASRYSKHCIYWSPKDRILDVQKLREFSPHIIIHLAGENFFGIWNKTRKQEILESRIEGTALLLKALKDSGVKPEMFLCASSVAYYGNRNDTILTEDIISNNEGYLTEVFEKTEKIVTDFRCGAMRTVFLRFGLILSPTGGIMPLLYYPFSKGLAGVIGSGLQYMSWITLEDATAAIYHIMKTPSIHGPVNVTSPHPIQNQAFTSLMSTAMMKPIWLWMSELLIKASSYVVGDVVQELLLPSRRATPEMLLQTDFVFKQSELDFIIRSLVVPYLTAEET